MSKRWPVVALGEILRASSDAVAVVGDTSYPNLGIYAFGRGVFAKPDIDGSASSAKTLYRVKSGQFIYSRLFAFEGAYALVPPALDGRFVSNEFPVFDWVADIAEPRFIAWIFRQPSVWADLAKQSVGMGDRRRRVHPEVVIRYQVRLPSIEKQKLIANRLDDIAARMRSRIDLTKEVLKELQSTLQAAFIKITRDAPLVRMGDIAPLVRRPVEPMPGSIYQAIGARGFGRGLFSKPDVRTEDLTWQQLFRVEAGDLVFSNIKAWEGAFAVATDEHDGKAGSHRYLTFVPDKGLTTPHFLWFYLQSRRGLSDVQAASPGSTDRNRTLSVRAMEAIKIPLPSLDAQRTFDILQAKARETLAAQGVATKELDALLPAMLHQVFGDHTAVAEAA